MKEAVVWTGYCPFIGDLVYLTSPFGRLKASQVTKIKYVYKNMTYLQVEKMRIMPKKIENYVKKQALQYNKEAGSLWSSGFASAC